MSEVTVSQDTDVIVVQEDDASSIVVILDDETEIIQTLEQGPPGPQGPPGDNGNTGDPGMQGPPGPPGQSVLYGPSSPSSDIGNDGDFYINTTNHFMYGPKENGIWPPGISLIGPQGSQGIQGPQGIQGVPGAPGNTVLYGAADPTAGQGVDGNFYINTTTHFMFGPKTAGAWPAGTSLVGPQGQQGPQGIQGPPGTGFPDAPNDGAAYGRLNATWTQVLPLTGGTISGSLNCTGQLAANSGVYASAPLYNIALTLHDATDNVSKFLRVNSAAGLEFINNANTAVIATLEDNGNFHAATGYFQYNTGVGGAVQSGLYSDGNALALRGFGSGGVFIQNGGGTLQYASFNQYGVSTANGSGGWLTKAGTAGNVAVNAFNIEWNTNARLWMDATFLGAISLTCDYRIKKDVADLPVMWDTVKALRPIKYTHKEFTPPSAEEKARETGQPFIPADDIERWGFMAHELQETLIESAASSTKDAPNAIQSPNPMTIIAALTKALQEAMVRIEALEARG